MADAADEARISELESELRMREDEFLEDAWDHGEEGWVARKELNYRRLAEWALAVSRAKS